MYTWLFLHRVLISNIGGTMAFFQTRVEPEVELIKSNLLVLKDKLKIN